MQLLPATTRPHPSLWHLTPARRGALIQVGLVLLGALVAAVAGMTVAKGHSLLLVAPLLAAALFILLARTQQAPYLLVVAGASTFSSTYALPQTGHLYPAEAMALLGVAVIVFSRYASFGGGMGALLVVLLATVGMGVKVGHGNGVPTLLAIDAARPMFLYLTFWLALAGLRANPQRFFKCFAGVVVFIVLLQLAQFALPGHRILKSAGETFVSSEGGFTRVRPPGLILVYFALIFAVAYIIWGPRHRRRLAVAFAACSGLGVILSLNRNMILGAIFGILAALLFTRGRGRAFAFLGTTAIVVTVVLVFLGSSGAVANRILSIGNPSGLQKTTLSDREYENRLAVPVIERHLAFGIGWGANYGAQIAQAGTGSLSPRSFIHNQYYGLLLRTGIVGLLAYLGLLGATALGAIRWTRRRREFDDGWLGPALLASVVGFAASAIVGIYVIDAGSAPGAGALFALGAFLREHLAQERQQIVR